MKIKVTANRKCRYCLGSGVLELPCVSMGITADARTVCPCVTSQLEITVFPKDYKITDREEPAPMTFIEGDQPSRDLMQQVEHIQMIGGPRRSAIVDLHK